jgi:hypothetical protein
MFSKFWLFLFTLLFFLVSCGDLESETNQDVREDYYQFQKLNLSPFDLDASIYLPDASCGIGTAFKPELIHAEGDYKWEIQVGRYFKLYIEDFGDFKYLMEEKIKQLEQSAIYEISFIKKTSKYIIYSRSIQSKESSLPSKRTFHFYGVFQIDGIFYQFMNREEGNTEKEVNFIEKSFNSIRKSNDNA